MGTFGFSLADRLGAKTMPCGVKGCTRTWIAMPGKKLGGRGEARADDPASSMCDPCRDKLSKLKDLQRPCDRPNCAGTWTWPASAQLEAFAARRPPPHALCREDEERLAAMRDIETACTTPGCTRTGKITARQQLLAPPVAAAGDARPPSPIAAVNTAADARATVADAKGGAPADAKGGAPADATAPPAADAPMAADTAPPPAAGAAPPPAADAGTAPAASAPMGADATTPPAAGAATPPAADAGAPPAASAVPAPRRPSAGARCRPCEQMASKLNDRAIHCLIRGCKNRWTWPAEDQLGAWLAGLPNSPPRRLCAECEADYGRVVDRNVKCRTSGCKKTWPWTRQEQLNATTQGRPVPGALKKMCPACAETFAGFKDVERPCRKSSCKRTWTDWRGAQLARAVRGKTADPYPRYCGECEKELGELEDRQVGCRTDGCEGTWTWSRQQQLAAGVRPVLPDEAEEPGDGGRGRDDGPNPEPAGGDAPASADAGAPAEADDAMAAAAAAPAAMTAAGETPAGPGSASAVGPRRGQRQGAGKRGRNRKRREIRLPERHCESCAEFLTEHKTMEIPCERCKTAIFWPPESQLQTHIGHWAQPTLCGACKRDVIEAARNLQREALRHQQTLPPEKPAAEAPDGAGGVADAAAAASGGPAGPEASTGAPDGPEASGGA